MISNVYRRLLALMPETPEDVGEVVEVLADGCTVELLTGARVSVRGAASMGDWVYIKDGAIQGPAPELETTEIEV